MDESSLQLLALITACVGVAGVTLSYLYSSPPSALPSEIQCMDDYSTVRIDGSVRDLRHVGNITLFKLEQRTPVVVYDRATLAEGATVVVRGEVDTYEGEKQVVANRVETR